MRYRIFGSCVTRDAFELSSDPEVAVERYYARSSLASAFAPAPVVAVDTGTIESSFQRRIVDWDLRKDFAASLAAAPAFDRLVIDLIDERFDLLTDGHGVATRSHELLRVEHLSETFRRIPSGSPEFVELWTEGWRRLLDLMDRTVGREAIIVHRARWARATESGAAFRGHTAASIARANSFLDELHAVMERDLRPHQIIAVPRSAVVGADEHRWGPSPFHYTRDYYVQLLRLLDRAARAGS